MTAKDILLSVEELIKVNKNKWIESFSNFKGIGCDT